MDPPRFATGARVLGVRRRGSELVLWSGAGQDRPMPPSLAACGPTEAHASRALAARRELFATGVRQAEVARRSVSPARARSFFGTSVGRPMASTACTAKVRPDRRPGRPTASSIRLSRPCWRVPTPTASPAAWTLDLIANVIERLTGVRHHPAWGWRCSRHRLGWSVQRPVRRATERDQAAIDRLGQGAVAGDPADAQRRRACLVFFDETALSLTPNVRRTWARVGQPAVLEHRFNWKKTSMAAALCYGVRGGGAPASPSISSPATTTPTP